MKRFTTVAVICAALTTLGGAVYAVGVSHTVDQAKLQFSTDAMTVARGDSIRFTNSDRTPHNIFVQGGGMFVDSGLQQPGDPVDVPFTKDGVFAVQCAIHPRMKMTVTVTE